MARWSSKTMHTRLPILLQLRREVSDVSDVTSDNDNNNNHTTPTNNITVHLAVTSSNEMINFTREDGNVLAVVEAAQDEAVKRSKSEFVQDSVVEIMVRRPDVP